MNLELAFTNKNWVLGNGIGTASLGGQYVARFTGSPPLNIWVEEGYGLLIIEMGILAPFLWLLWTGALVITGWRVASAPSPNPLLSDWLRNSLVCLPAPLPPYLWRHGPLPEFRYQRLSLAPGRHSLPPARICSSNNPIQPLSALGKGRAVGDFNSECERGIRCAGLRESSAVNRMQQFPVLNERMTAALAHRGPDSSWSSGSWVMCVGEHAPGNRGPQ